ncbi:prepilin peptidase [Clostridium cellulovorans]|uniref:Peptidase A24A prepilin type IV n=1 Tax=Clostridium cellulovorans (strain ATCC 35296 / DSM 3052 / OCM 3 / 743B) TaxID=573061 RepID=D9SP83_CLOC7|nr:A24 family peptidase [Clostridium cellulovorans]ADL52048.1 peptidase A24A prepilin type IV [Clostridium cellulovorans 743B]
MNGDEKIVLQRFLEVAFDNPLVIIKGFLYAVILLYVSLSDIKIRIIPDKVHIMILLVSLININLKDSLLGLFLVSIPFIITALISENGIGGGDIKLMGASGFLLGVKGGFLASIIGLATAIVTKKVSYKIKSTNKDEAFPLAPYLSIGCFLSYLISGGF